jgi:ABC transporter substrate binding protein
MAKLSTGATALQSIRNIGHCRRCCLPPRSRRFGLVGYGVELNDLFRRAAAYVDRVLKGEKPADLPVQAPTRFELIVNLKTAKNLGLLYHLKCSLAPTR